MAFTWGDVCSNGKGRLGIDVTLSDSNLETSVTIDVWVWSLQQVNDKTNDLYFNDNSSSATTKVKSDVTVYHTSTNWDTSNRTKLYTYTTKVSRTNSDQKIECSAKLSSIEVFDETISVTAEYTIKRKNKLTIKYHVNGGSLDSDTYTVSSGVIYDENGSSEFQNWYYNVPGDTGLYNASTFGLYRTGHTFQGWKVGSSGTTVFDQDDATVKPSDLSSAISSGDVTVTMYAVWKANTYTISYNANGGSGAPTSQTKTYGVTLVLSSTKPTKSGYTFLGWNSSSTATSAQYTSGGNYTNNASATLYAVWKANTYTITYNANGGSGTMSNTTVTYGVDTETRKNTFTRTGYTFTGWYVYRHSDKLWYCEKSDGTTGWYSESSIPNGYEKYLWSDGGIASKTTPVDGDTITFYAQWEPNTFTIKYNANGGSGTMSNTVVTYGVSTATRTNTFTRAGYAFIGWHAYRHSDKLWYCKKSDGTTGWYASGSIPSGWDYYLWSDGGSASKTTSVNNDTITLYAVWKSMNVGWKKVDNEWEKYSTYIKIDGKWVEFVIYYKDETGTWRQGII